MRSQADIPRFIIINRNYYDDVPPLDMGSPLKRRGQDGPPPSELLVVSSSPSMKMIMNDGNNNNMINSSLHEA
jgi:hypothetical protein